MTLYLSDLRPGDAATIVGIDRADVDPANARQLHEMGFDEGVDVRLLHRAPFGGDPVMLRVGNMGVALRKSLAAMVAVERGSAPTCAPLRRR